MTSHQHVALARQHISSPQGGGNFFSSLPADASTSLPSTPPSADRKRQESPGGSAGNHSISTTMTTTTRPGATVTTCPLPLLHPHPPREDEVTPPPTPSRRRRDIDATATPPPPRRNIDAMSMMRLCAHPRAHPPREHEVALSLTLSRRQQQHRRHGDDLPTLSPFHRDDDDVDDSPSPSPSSLPLCSPHPHVPLTPAATTGRLPRTPSSSRAFKFDMPPPSACPRLALPLSMRSSSSSQAIAILSPSPSSFFQY